MQVDVRFRGLESSAHFAQYAQRRVHQHLSRFGREIGDVVLRISDVNGPRGGRDKLCQLAVRGPGIGALHLSETHDDLYAGLDIALGRLDHTIGRAIERARAQSISPSRRAS